MWEVKRISIFSPSCHDMIAVKMMMMVMVVVLVMAMAGSGNFV
jgi:hypothetical protein